MKVGNDDDRVALVLKLHTVQQAANEVTKVQSAGEAVAGQHVARVNEMVGRRPAVEDMGNPPFDQAQSSPESIRLLTTATGPKSRSDSHVDATCPGTTLTNQFLGEVWVNERG